MLLLHEAIRATGVMPTMLLDSGAPWRREATGTPEIVPLREAPLVPQSFCGAPYLIHR